METDNGSTETTDAFVIKATNIPREFFENHDVAKSYFRRFGKFKRVMFKPKRNALLIEYANEDGMLNALEVAGEYKGQLFSVTREREGIAQRKKTKKDPDPDWTDDPDIRSELEAMGAFRQQKSYDLRSEGMAVDPVEQNQKMKQRRWKGASTGSPLPQKKKVISGKDTISTEQIELSQIIKQQAFTVEDKFRILDARDKLIRIKMKKNIELSKAKATVGTCPDMCPEKERLMRETQHQVALYEQEENGKGIMNPRIAVKQYSRSSADQEAPLPQELRPVSVLQMTMGYLMHRIIGLCDTPDVNIAEWYHFLWDRSRGIRKDITQQELCCQGSVELVEQCARFHIFCSARLVSEDPSVFDQKINTENLTKCLQTLKYMYHDLQLKGESCRNEPEFRAYIILLNLNDGNFMWEVQQLQTQIQQSKEVKFALEVYSSLDKHNYVKFFKLVNSTTFLNSCILMRYFIQVRISAINILLKSYSPRISQTSLPVYYLTKILGFEDTESAIDFCETYGLYTNVERTRIILDKSGFSLPEYPYILDRAKNLVESKRQLSAGEIVCGRELPPKLYETHIPQNSFDVNGYLKMTAEFDEVDSIRKDEPVKTVEKKERTVSEPPRIFSSPITVQSQPPIIFAPPKPAEIASIFKPRPSIFTSEKVLPTKSLWSQPTKPNIFGNANKQPASIFGGEIVPLEPPTKIEIPEPVPEEDDKQAEIERIRVEEEEKKRREEEERKRQKQKEEDEKRRAELQRKLKKRNEEKKKNGKGRNRKKRMKKDALNYNANC